MVRILKLINCCVILHNLLLGEDPCPSEWFDEDDDVSDIDDCERVPTEYDLLNRPIRAGQANDERRRRLQTYLEWKEYVL